MLKVLRLLSIFSVIAAICIVIAMSLIVWKGDPEIKRFLDRTGIVDRMRETEQPEAHAKTPFRRW